MRRTLAAVLVLSVSACGGSTGGGGGGGGDGSGNGIDDSGVSMSPDLADTPDLSMAPDLAFSADVACADSAAAFCKRLSACAPALIKLQYGDVAKCSARALIGCKASFGLPGTSASARRADACANELANVSCADLAENKLPSDCVPLPGALQSGAACATDAQCVSAACVKPVAGGCGTCGKAPKAGESCAKLACAGGLSCGAGNAICSPLGQMNDACDASHSCTPTLACKGSNSMGTCVTPIALNGACDPTAAEYSGCWLAQGQYCAPGSRTCQPLTFAGAGAACGLVNNNYIVCAASGHCTSTNIFLPGTCLAAAADGAACDPTSGPNCTPPALCTGGICKLTDPVSCK